MLSGQIPYLRGKEEAGKRAKKGWLEGVWRAMKGWLQCCGMGWVGSGTISLIQNYCPGSSKKWMTRYIIFLSLIFRPMNSGLCTATVGLSCKIEDGRYLEDSSF